MKNQSIAQGTILVVDSHAGVRQKLQRVLESEGYTVATASDGEQATRLIRETGCPDVIIADGVTPGAEATWWRHLREDPATSYLPIILMTASRKNEKERRASGADVLLGKPPKAAEVLAWVRCFVRARQGALDATRVEAMLVSIAAAVEARSVHTEGHLWRVAQYSSRLASAAGVDVVIMASIRRAALLHDIGMIGVPDEILRQPRTLTPEEFACVKKHAALGADLVRPLPDGQRVSEIVRGHHERWQGEGYPDGLTREAIPIGARVVAIADAFDALTANRPYRPALSQSEALEVLWFGADAQWDPNLVELFAGLMELTASDGRKSDPSDVMSRYLVLATGHA